MKQNKVITKLEFSKYYKPILKGYSESFKEVIAPIEVVNGIIFGHGEEVTTDGLLLKQNFSDQFLLSFIYRLLGVREIRECRDKKDDIDIRLVWDLISKSIKIIPSSYTISSIGSQGFLSIPLYKFDDSLETFDFIRLHIWDNSLDQFMDLKKCEDFAVHSHTFYAKSWVVTGKVINDRYAFVNHSLNSSHSFFEVQYNNSLNQVNQHTSKAVNKGIDTELIKISQEVHFANGFYEIPPSKLHRSGHLNSPQTTATFFSFTGKDGVGDSFVIGPKEISESEVNRKVNIPADHLLDKIENQL